MSTIPEELTERSHTLIAALRKGSLSAVSASLPPLAEALAPAAAEHWGLVKTMGRNIGHIMQELTDMGFALDALDKMVSSKSKEVRAASCWALAEVGAERPENITGLANRLAKDDAWEVRDQIAAAYDERIGPAQPRPLLEIMRRWSNDADERVRRAPALALIRRARRDRTPVLAILENLRRDNSIYVRKGVVYCLQQAWGRAENPTYGPVTPDSPIFLLRVLREWAKDANSNTRWVVAYTLAHTWVAPYLADALSILRLVARDPSETAQKAAQAALLGLRKLNNPLLRRTIETWAADNYEQNVSRLARLVLAEMPAEEATAAPLPPMPLPAAPARPSENGQRSGQKHRRHQRPFNPSPALPNGATRTPNEAPIAPIAEANPGAAGSVAAIETLSPPLAAPTAERRNRRTQAVTTEQHSLPTDAPIVAAAVPDANAVSPTAPSTPARQSSRKPKTQPRPTVSTTPDTAVVSAATETAAVTPAPTKRSRKPKSTAAVTDHVAAQTAAEETSPAPKRRRSSPRSSQTAALKEESDG